MSEAKYWNETPMQTERLSRKLRGFSHTQMTHQRGFKGSKLGPANRGRRLSRAEIKRIEQDMRERGKL